MNEVLEQDSLIRLSVFNHASDALQPDFSKNALFCCFDSTVEFKIFSNYSFVPFHEYLNGKEWT